MSTAVNTPSPSSATSVASLPLRPATDFDTPFSKEVDVQKKVDLKPGSRRFFDKSPEGSQARKTYLTVFLGGTFMVILMIFTILPIYWGSLWKIPTRNLNGWVVVRSSVTYSLPCADRLLAGLRWRFYRTVCIASIGIKPGNSKPCYVDCHPCHEFPWWTSGTFGCGSE